MRKLVLTALSLALLLLPSARPARAWGGVGHSYVAKLAIASLPDSPLKQLLARNTDWLEHDHVSEHLWPTLALIAATDLDAERDIVDPRIVGTFDLSTTLEIPKRFGLVRESDPFAKF